MFEFFRKFFGASGLARGGVAPEAPWPRAPESFIPVGLWSRKITFHPSFVEVVGPLNQEERRLVAEMVRAMGKSSAASPKTIKGKTKSVSQLRRAKSKVKSVSRRRTAT